MSRLKGLRQGLPLSVRLALILASILVVGLAVAGTASVVMLRSSLMEQLDLRLANALTGLEVRPAFTADAPTDYIVMTFDADGTKLQQAPDDGRLVGPAPALTTLGWDDPRAGESEPFTVAAATGKGSWRMIASHAQMFYGGGGVVAIGLSMDSVDQTVSRLVRIVISTAVIVAALASSLGYVMVRRSLRPLRAVQVTAGRIAAGDLTQRVPPQRPGTEVGQLTSSLNTMLTQIETSFAVRQASEDRMRRFIADASHELRTPLAAIRGYGELYRMGALSDSVELAGAMKRIEDEAARMGALVSDLLQLTRLEEGRGLRRDPIDLTVLMADAAADLGALDPTRPVKLVPFVKTASTVDGGPAEITTSATEKEPAQGPPAESRNNLNLTPGGIMVMGDEARLRQVMTNLVGNAVRHTPSGTAVEIAGGFDNGPDGSRWAVIEIRDHGPGIPPDAAKKVFERFFRLDSSRSRSSGGGSGLGLAIVASVIEAHGGRVLLRPSDGGGATFRVDLPCN